MIGGKKMKKLIKKVMLSLLSVFIVFCSFGFTNNVYATEKIIQPMASNPYPEHDWINIGTITLTPAKINEASDVRSAIVKLIGSIVGSVYGGISGALVGYITSEVENGHTTFYIKLTQYVSTDYQWHYYSYTVYKDKACTQPVGTYVSSKWKDRYARVLYEQYVENLMNNF